MATLDGILNMVLKSYKINILDLFQRVRNSVKNSENGEGVGFNEKPKKVFLENK